MLTVSLPASRARSQTAPRGFALLITITLVAFLVLILVALASLTRVETQVAANSQSLDQARQNALMALNIAIGQLQRHTGPDQRVTATADLRRPVLGSATDPVSGVSLSAGAASAALDSINNYWNDARNRRWVGAWRDPDPDRTLMVNPDTPASTEPRPELLSWLVSGNEQHGDDFLPETQVDNFTVSGVTSASAATANFGTTAQPYRLLVGNGTTRIVTGTDLNRAVVAPLVAITSDHVPGHSGQKTVGSYAWWVGDEGVKARADIVDSLAGNSDPVAQRVRLQSAQRNAVEAMTGLATLYPANNASLANIITSPQIAQLENDPALRGDLQNELAERYHDLTVHSRGVLSDTRHGGLKADLSWMLGQASDTDFRDDLREIYGSTTLVATDNILTSTVTPYVSAPGTNSFTAANFALGLSRTPTWSQLRSYFNMGNDALAASMPGVMNAGAAQSRIQLRDRQGLGPIVTQIKLFFGLQVDDADTIKLRLRPLVVLANPYDITLTGDYWVRFERPFPEVRVGTPTDPVAKPSGFVTSGSASFNSRLNLVIRGSSIPPGEARVYCLDQDYHDTGSGALLEMNLAEGFDPGPVVTIPTTAKLGTHTHAALFAVNNFPSAFLYGANPAGTTTDKLLQYFYGRGLSGSANINLYLVYATGIGETRDGGGGWAVMTDSRSTNTQQSNFLQYNPRALSLFWSGNSGSDPHPMENTFSFPRDGAPGNDSWFGKDLIFDTSGDRVRWGPVNMETNRTVAYDPPPAGLSDETGYVNVLYTLPRAESPVVSIPQLQHFSPSGFVNNGRITSTGDHYALHANSFQVNYPTGNSYPNPRVPRDRAYLAKTNGTSGNRDNIGIAYDASWLNNEVLADRYYFSSYPASGNVDLADNLINANLRPFRSPADVAWDDETRFRGSPRQAAVNLMAEGAFNVNSTSVEAWKALLASLRGIPVKGSATGGTPSPRGLYPEGEYSGSRNGNSKDAWAGFHNLSDAEIDELASAIVLEVHKRGPFLSFADFLNRRLVATADDPLDTGLSGAVQAAIDSFLNQNTDVDSVMRIQSRSDNFAEAAYQTRNMTAGSAGYLLQADLLSPLAPGLASRSDTFVIRTYGDVQNPATGEVTARAWCEAIVQRVPDYVEDSLPATDTPAVGSTNATFGRKYQVVSFRWLSPDEI